MNLINWLRQPDRYWIWLNIGQAKFEGAIKEIRVILTQQDADAFVDYEMEQAENGGELVKVKTDLINVSIPFLSKFIDPIDGDPTEKIINFQRYRYKQDDRYYNTCYLFEVKA
tara:strand:+ start:2153 stop:2491 length:339 start_codon:yes stop_codon:yes gene_type:complete